MELNTHPLAGKSMAARQAYLDALAQSERLLKDEIATCAADPWWWLTGWALTLDEQAIPTRRPFPALDYLRELTRAWLTYPLLLTPKSRQMLVSWLFSALFVWDAEFHKGRRFNIHTKKYVDAAYQVRRGWLVWDSQPWFLKEASQANTSKKGADIEGKLTFSELNSLIEALPEGSDHVRGSTPTALWEDEFQLQDDADKILEGAMPALGLGKWKRGTTGGRLYLVGTAKPGKMAEIYKAPAVNLHSVMRGIREWDNAGGFHIFELHYTADPNKDPSTLAGKRWYDAERMAWFAAGGTEAGWQAEYEINFDSFGGQHFYPEISREEHWLAEFTADGRRPILTGWDFGYHNPVFVAAQLTPEDQMVNFMANVGRDIDFDIWAPPIFKWLAETFGEKAEIICFVDPEGNSKDDKGETTLERMRRIAREAGVEVRVFFRKVERDEGGRQIRRLLRPRGDGKPSLVFAGHGFQVFRALQNLELHPEKDEPLRLSPNIDIYDALKYLISGVYDKNDRPLMSFTSNGKQRLATLRNRELERRKQAVTA